MVDNKSQSAQYTYQSTQISTATKEQLLLITYDIGIRSCRMAEAALETGNNKTQDFDLAHREILRAQEVIRELMVTLNTEKGGEMAQNLMRLYDYMYQQLVEANVKKDPKNIHTVLTMLEDLKETWEEALMKLLKEYQAAHPEDEDLKVVGNLNLKELKTAPTVETRAAAAPAKAQAGGLNIAG
ncbi:MAG: flagellar export chaperone FliS [Synergistaceae bacterium]|jgi:flagellar protein FliS|nr:flagellar export chaperone FliS [Synergistaceae bacterium]